MIRAISEIETQIYRLYYDDEDYCTVAGIQVFTANRNVITAARTRSKLLTR